jgi:Zn-dependent alcohol dehydrogenase
MRTTAAVLHDVNKPYSIEPVELDPPRRGEVLVQPGDSVAVIGCGGVGLNVLQGARLAGATTIVAVDIKDAALDFARKSGATHVVNARTENAVERVKALTGGGAHWAFEPTAAGPPPAWRWTWCASAAPRSSWASRRSATTR